MIDRPGRGDSGGAATPLLRVDQAFQDDLRCALASTVPVLVTGPSAVAEEIARRIHRAARSVAPLVTIDADTDPSSGAIHDAFARARTGGMILIRNVDRLSSAQQDAFRDVLDRGGVRVVASAGAGLFALVERGAFDARLFYRLNQIHLVAPAG